LQRVACGRFREEVRGPRRDRSVSHFTSLCRQRRRQHRRAHAHRLGRADQARRGQASGQLRIERSTRALERAALAQKSSARLLQTSKA
jgi:hypothetical protein